MFHTVTAERKQKNRKYHQQNLKWLSDAEQVLITIKY